MVLSSNAVDRAVAGLSPSLRTAPAPPDTTRKISRRTRSGCHPKQRKKCRPDPGFLGGSGEIPQACDEAGPLVPAEGQDGPVRVLGVADGDGVGEVARHLDAVSTAVAAVAGLAPHRADLDAVCAAVAAVAGLAPAPL